MLGYGGENGMIVKLETFDKPQNIIRGGLEGWCTFLASINGLSTIIGVTARPKILKKKTSEKKF